MFPRKLISGFTLLSLGLLLMFVTACSSSVDNPYQQTLPTQIQTPNAAITPAATSSEPKAKLNINTASQADFLGTIPGSGNRMVHEFEEYRPYKSILQFRKEIGKYVDQNAGG